MNQSAGGKGDPDGGGMDAGLRLAQAGLLSIVSDTLRVC